MKPKDTRLPLVVLGSTGSIGQQTLDIVRQNPDRFVVKGLAAKSQSGLLCEQALEFQPDSVAVADSSLAGEIKSKLGPQISILEGQQGVQELARHPDAYAVVAAMVGFAGLRAVVSALEAKKHIALANKETLVAAGPLVKRTAAAAGCSLVPVDSEHSSLYQCMGSCRAPADLKSLIITASGGPFWNLDASEFPFVTPEQAVNHPRWNMGRKISVDSATMFNKGLEIIEAARLFDVPAEQIDVAIHPQSIVHGLIEMQDATILAALSPTDMRIPISYALGELEELAGIRAKEQPRPEHGVPGLRLSEVAKLEFFEPDHERFPSIELGFESLRQGESMPIVYNAANEAAVDFFLEKRIRFTDIAHIVRQSMDAHRCYSPDSLEQIEETDSWARSYASDIVNDSIRPPEMESERTSAGRGHLG